MKSKYYKYLALSLTIPTIRVVYLLLTPSNAQAFSGSALGRAIYRFIENPSLFAGIGVAIVGILLIIRYGFK